MSSTTFNKRKAIKGEYNKVEKQIEEGIWQISKNCLQTNSEIERYYKVKVSVRNLKGKKPIRPEKVDYATSIAHARNLRHQLREQLYSEVYRGGSVTLLEFYEKYYLASLERSLQPSGLYNTKKNFEGQILPVLGKIRVREMTVKHLEDFFFIHNAGKSPGTVHNYRKNIKGILESARQHGLMDKDILAEIKNFPKITKKSHQYLSDEQMDRLLRNLKETGHKYYLHIAVTYYFGLRVGEARGLVWGDIDFEKKFIIVRRTFDARYGFKDCPKDYAQRLVPISPCIYNLLHETFLATQPKADDFVLPQHRKWRSREHCDILHYELAKLQLPKIRWHDLRASFTMSLFKGGVPPIKIQQMLGHESLDTTQVYMRKLGYGLKGATDCLDFSKMNIDRNTDSGVPIKVEQIN